MERTSSPGLISRWYSGVFRKRENCATPIADTLARTFAEGRFGLMQMYKEVASFWIRQSGRINSLPKEKIAFGDLYLRTGKLVGEQILNKLITFYFIGCFISFNF